jgi:EmrB/QacA subfamily drug resistance transporter
MTTAATGRRPVSAPSAAGTFTHRQILVILSGLMLGMFLAALDQTIVSTAIRTIADDLQGLDVQAWVTTAYLITSTISTPLYGKLSDLFGRKPFFLFAIAIFTVGSVLCTISTSMYELAVFRAVQGLGAGGLMSLAFTIIADIVPPRERARYQGIFVAVFGTSSVIGPLIGGAFAGADTLLGIDGWRWVFLINVPIAIVALVVVARVLNIPHTRRDHRIDWPGAVLLTVGLVPLLLVAEQGREWGWGSGGAIACYLIGVVGLVLFVVDQRFYGDDALLPLRLFRLGVFSITSVSNVIVGMGMFGGIVTIPLYLQIVKGATPTESGLLMLPLVLGIMVGSVTSGQLTARTGRYKVFPLIGVPLMIAAMLLMHFRVDVDTALWETDLYMAMFGIGLGFCMQTLIVAVQNAVPPRDIGVATGAATFFRSMGGTLGVAVFLSILFSTVGDRIGDEFATIAATPAFQAALADPAVRANPANAVVFQALQGGTPPGAAGGVLQDSSFLQQMDPRLARPFLLGFADAMQTVFLVAACVLVLAFLLLIFLKELPLRTQSALQARQTQSDGAAATGSPGRTPLVAAVALLAVAQRIERRPADSPALLAAAARLVPSTGPHDTGEADRALRAARTVLRPVAARLILRSVGAAAPPVTAPASVHPTPALETTP